MQKKGIKKETTGSLLKKVREGSGREKRSIKAGVGVSLAEQRGYEDAGGGWHAEAGAVGGRQKSKRGKCTVVGEFLE